jgi:hypothetical protein
VWRLVFEYVLTSSLLSHGDGDSDCNVDVDDKDPVNNDNDRRVLFLTCLIAANRRNWVEQVRVATIVNVSTVSV